MYRMGIREEIIQITNLDTFCALPLLNRLLLTWFNTGWRYNLRIQPPGFRHIYSRNAPPPPLFVCACVHV